MLYCLFPFILSSVLSFSRQHFFMFCFFFVFPPAPRFSRKLACVLRYQFNPLQRIINYNKCRANSTIIYVLCLCAKWKAIEANEGMHDKA